MKNVLFGLCLGFAAILSSAAFAGTLINVDFQPGGAGDPASTDYTGQGVISDPSNDVWNVVAPDTGGEFNGEFGTGGFYSFTGAVFVVSNLLDSSGATTEVSLAVSKAPIGNPAESERGFAIYTTNENSIANIATNATALMQDFLISHTDGYDENFVTINNLATGGIYNLVLYGAGDFSTRNTRFIVGGMTKATTGVPEVPHSLTETEDYVVFNGVVANEGSITITYLNGQENIEGNFNGFQIEEADSVVVSDMEISDTTAISFASEAGAVYRLQYAVSPLTNAWETAPVIYTGTGGTVDAFDPTGFSTQKTYRVIQE